MKKMFYNKLRIKLIIKISTIRIAIVRVIEFQVLQVLVDILDQCQAEAI